MAKTKRLDVAEAMVHMDHHWVTGEELKFTPPGDKPGRRGIFIKVVKFDRDPALNVCEIKLKGDPFTVCVHEQRLVFIKSPSETESEERTMATGTKPTAKELRRQARALDIEDWETLSLGDLRTQVAEAEAAAEKPKAPARKSSAKKATAKAKVEEIDEELEDEDVDADEDDVEAEDAIPEDDADDEPAPKAKRGAAKKAPAKKAAAKKAAPAKKAARNAPAEPIENENGNPFAPGTNMYEMTELLIAGGKRSSLVKKLKRKITLAPRGEAYEDEDKELDRRLLICGQTLRKNHGFNVVRDGRGADATIVAEPPNA